MSTLKGREEKRKIEKIGSELLSGRQLVPFDNQTEAKAHQNRRFSSYHYPTTIGGNSMKK